jgi:hypothetical protein
MTRFDPLVQLATHGERLGWTFRDRNQYRRRFAEPAPALAPMPRQLVDRLYVLEKERTNRIVIPLVVGAVMGFFLSCAGTNQGGASGFLLLFLALVCVAGGVGVAALSWNGYNNAKQAYQQWQRENAQAHAFATAQWQDRLDAFDRYQQWLIDTMAEWGAATPSPGKRIDVFGGDDESWTGLLTILGGSLLGTHGLLTLVDFSNGNLGDELIDLADRAGHGVQATMLLSQVSQLDLTADLPITEFVHSINEAMHGSDPGKQHEKSLDRRLLERIIGALNEDTVTVAKLHAGLERFVTQDDQPELDAAENRNIRRLLSDDNRKLDVERARLIESYLSPLRAMGSDKAPSSGAKLRCLITEPSGQQSDNRLLQRLIVQYLIRRAAAAGESLGSLIIIGADRLAYDDLDQLSTFFLRSGNRLVLFYRHLQDQAVKMLDTGGGDKIFLQLTGDDEAETAAKHIGKEHSFVLSQYTVTHGSSTSVTRGTGGGEDHGNSMTAGRDNVQHGVTASRSRNWSESETTGTNWSAAESAQRVYEFAVDPGVFKRLRRFAMLVVKDGHRGEPPLPVVCDPAIVTFPRAILGPLPYLALPGEGESFNGAAPLPAVDLGPPTRYGR